MKIQNTSSTKVDMGRSKRSTLLRHVKRTARDKQGGGVVACIIEDAVNSFKKRILFYMNCFESFDDMVPVVL